MAAAFSPALRPWERDEVQADLRLPDDFQATVDALNGEFRQQWTARQLAPADQADALTLARRLALGLMGTVPSLEEIRRFETLPSEAVVDEYLAVVLNDRRCHEYLAERLARGYVGVQEGAFVAYRRRRFVKWIADQLAERRPYDALCREMITGRGLGTGNPESNFVIATMAPGQPDGLKPNPSEIAARVSRGMLGVRIDCAECHDHPFEPWKQSDFHGLAAFFGGVTYSFRGLRDTTVEYKMQDKKTGDERTFAAQVPYHPELLPAAQTRADEELRDRLARWVTAPENERFSLAIANRIWAVVMGRPLVEPVDDIRAGAEVPRALQILADDFRAHRFDLRRMIRVIVAADVFRLESRLSDESVSPQEHLAAWAVFPITRLRTDQIVSSIEQATLLPTLDQESNLLLRIVQTIEENDFIKLYGDEGEDEFRDSGGTIPQRLIMMNGKLVRRKTKAEPPGIFVNAATQISRLAPTDERAVEIAYLTILTRHPTPTEREHFIARVQSTKGRRRDQALEDLCWTLLNSTEFAWNH